MTRNDRQTLAEPASAAPMTPPEDQPDDLMQSAPVNETSLATEIVTEHDDGNPLRVRRLAARRVLRPDEDPSVHWTIDLQNATTDHLAAQLIFDFLEPHGEVVEAGFEQIGCLPPETDCECHGQTRFALADGLKAASRVRVAIVPLRASRHCAAEPMRDHREVRPRFPP